MKLLKLFVIVGLVAFFLAASPLDNVRDIITKLEAYNREFPQVRVHLIFNQPKYAPGDTAYFKALFLTEDYRPIADKQILTLELKDKEGNNVSASNFRVVDGEGSNQIILSNAMTPGEYSILAYSEWMRNFDRDLFFRKTITIAGRKQIVPEKTVGDSVRFYPEGGYLVSDIENRVIIKGNRNTTGKILDQTGRLIDEFEIDDKGIAEITFTPKGTLSYHAILSGVNREFPLSVTDDRCSLRVTPYGSGSADVTITASPNSSLSKQEIYLLALSKGRVMYSTPLKLENNTAKIPISNLHPGLNQFFLFDRKDNVIGERIYYVTPSSANVSITAETESIEPRGLASVDVVVSDEGGRPIAGSFTTRVINSTLFPGTQSASFETELNIFNDLPELRIEFEKSNLKETEFLANLDRYLITQKWKRINWADVLNPPKERVKYPFKYSLDLKGRAYFKASGDPVPDSTMIMIYQQKAMVGYEAYANKKGELSFPFLYDFSGTDQIFYTMEFKKREKQQDFYIKPELEISSTNTVGSIESDTPDIYGEYKFRKGIIDKSFQFYAAPEEKIDAKIINPNREYEDELGGADVTFRVDDYLVFPTMSDLIHEVISGLQTRVASNVRTVRVVFLRNTYTVIPKGDPLYIIDGVFTKNTEFFLNLNPEDIFSIKLVNNENKLNRLGGLGKYGIVIVQTKKSVAKSVAEASTIFSISGLSQELEYRTPVYSGPSKSRRPDLRSSIYWSPKVSTASNGRANLRFYASDDANPIEIEVQGMANDGRAFSARKTINVNAPGVRP